MPKNIGTTDKVIRVLVALTIAILYLSKQINGTAAIILGVFAAIFVLTSLVGFCPLYFPFHISTRKKS